MLILGPLGFTAPWLLAALAALPVLWILLRIVPPAPIRRRFPGVALLLGLTDDTTETDKTPWWLLLLRMAAVAAAILAFAGPVLNPKALPGGTAPLLVLIDGGWPDATDWPRRIDRAAAHLDEAARSGRPAALVQLTDAPQPIVFQAADTLRGPLTAMVPKPWLPRDQDRWAADLPEGRFDTVLISDGLSHSGRASLVTALQARGTLRVQTAPRPVFALHPPTFEAGVVLLQISRHPVGAPITLEVAARGPDPAGIDRELARVPLSFAAGSTTASGTLTVPPELRNRITRFELDGQRTAGAVSLTDDGLKRRKVALVMNRSDAEGLQLLSPTHYLREALQPVAELTEGGLSDLLLSSPDVVVLADVARLTQVETDALLDWVDEGGLLVRFAGPQLASSDIARQSEDPLIPVRLREGGRTVGGAMSWGEPKTLAPFPETSPFFGLTVPPDVTVSAQVLAQPDPDLTERTIAALEDGTPLVTRKIVGDGQVVLFHVTANAEWTTLPLSGLFVQMLERLAVSTRPALTDAVDLQGQTFVPETVLDGYGVGGDAGDLAGVPGADLARAIAEGPDQALPPGLYAGLDRSVALNAGTKDLVLSAASWPVGTRVEGLDAPEEQGLKGLFLTLALLALAVDVLASLALSGRLTGARQARAMAAALGLAVALTLVGGSAPGWAQTQDEGEPGADAFAIEATTSVVLAHVRTGDDRVDDVAAAGLRGLGDRLWERTAVEPAEPMAVDVETDELLFFPFLYWPLTADQPTPSAAAYARLNDYLRTGGLILFDTRDGDVAGMAGSTPEAQALQRIAAGLDIPPLEPLPQDHVLTRAFYLVQDSPGRHAGAAVWVEAAPPDAVQAEGMPFRNLNDGVTPVVIGGNDWAGAWASDATGLPLLPVGRGFAGERQREMSYRFGINLIMHVLTGNYKSDQVHVPALLDRLGQ